MTRASSGQAAVQNLCPALQQDFANLEAERISANEGVVWAANVAWAATWKKFGGGSWAGESAEFGYVVLTSERVIRVFFEPKTGWFAPRRFTKEKDHAHPKAGQEFRAYLPPDSPISSDEQRTRNVRESQVSRIIDVNRDTFGWRDATLFPVAVTLFGNSTFGFSFWRREDVDYFYDAMQTIARRNMSGTKPGGLNSSDVPRLIESLAGLLEAGVLTQAEFDEKKREFLDRL